MNLREKLEKKYSSRNFTSQESIDNFVNELLWSETSVDFKQFSIEELKNIMNNIFKLKYLFSLNCHFKIILFIEY